MVTDFKKIVFLHQINGTFIQNKNVDFSSGSVMLDDARVMLDDAP